MRRKGFTLAEVMVAILFLSIAMFGYFALHLRIIHSATTLDQRQGMRRHVERANYVTRYGASPPHIGVDPLIPPTQAALVYAADPNDDYTGTVSTTVQTTPPALYRVEYDIHWTNKHGSQSYVLDTFIREKDTGW
ncbi:MAG: prepilin-type N-terminal cleavage/methylation domain-containing protein [Candidatus Eremiobacteraeota bacterium]|nr:prepilin-type N-terminal cleavage/methylation domain-containing protein [Candidatus Eremiobacteraeota bacterium]